MISHLLRKEIFKTHLGNQIMMITRNSKNKIKKIKKITSLFKKTILKIKNFLTVYKMSSFSTVTHQTNNQTSLPRKNQETLLGHYLIINK
jgi:hypothetical protein